MVKTLLWRFGGGKMPFFTHYSLNSGEKWCMFVIKLHKED
jgi:hypothetical protein